MNLTEKKAINERIEEIKKEWKSLTSSKIGKMYEVLSKYVALKKQINSKYAIRSLEWDKDINLKEHQIRYIFSYKYISCFSKRLIDNGKINDSAVCFLINKSSIFREPQWQNRAVKLFVEGSISISQLGELKIDEIKSFLLGELKLRKNDKYLLSATKSLRSILSRLKEIENLIPKSRWKEGLINASSNLNNYINKF